MNIYRHLDYRQIIKGLVKARKQSEPAFNYSLLAEAIGVQKTHISKVLSGTAQLSSDQLYLLVRYFSLADEEAHFLGLLLEKERTGLARRRQELEAKIGAIQARHRDTRKNLKARMVEPGAEDRARIDYYLDPTALVVDSFLMIPKYQNNPDAIRQVLGMGGGHFERVLANMEKLGVIERDPKSKACRRADGNTVLTKESPLCTPHQVLLRLLSAFHSLRIPPDERFNFSLTIAANARTKTFIHDRFLEFLREIEAEIIEAPSEEVYQINFELFPWKLS